jgi:uncharacterized protein (DUF1499 family)
MARARWSWTAWTALVVALAAGAALALSGPAYRMGWLGLGAALRPMLTWAAYGGLAAAVLAVVALLATRGSATAGMRIAALLALILGLGAAVVPYRWAQTAGAVPAIHDISTDSITPPLYVELAAERRDLQVPNSLDYLPDVAAQQATGYPDIGPAFLAEPPAQAYSRALDLVRARGWAVAAADDAARRIEATDTTFWFGFKDDVAIRVSSLPDGTSRVDVRSVSRVGRSDVGTNARRIREFLADLTR